MAIHPINIEDDYDLTSIPSSYSIRKEPLHPQVSTFQRTAEGSAELFKQAFIEECHNLLPLRDAPVHTIASQYHCLNIIMKTIEYLSPGQIAVDVCDQPVYALTKEVQYRNPEKF